MKTKPQIVFPSVRWTEMEMQASRVGHSVGDGCLSTFPGRGRRAASLWQVLLAMGLSMHLRVPFDPADPLGSPTPTPRDFDSTHTHTGVKASFWGRD